MHACMHLNYLSFIMGNSAGKVILSNGAVLSYNEPLTVAELMLDHPQEAVVEFNTTPAVPLPADYKLDCRKLYIMIPIRRAKTASLHHPLLLRMKPFLLPYTGLVPFFVRFTARNNDVVQAQPADHFADILEGRPEFLSCQISGKVWKPTLDPIKEKAIRAKVRHWIF